ncbi:MAG: family 43 glycosylhydrolase [Acutalibacteraceae bacterium]|jgi:lysophospholipase L1-like esterase
MKKTAIRALLGLVLAAALLIGAPPAGAQAEPAVSKPGSILILGDSIAAGYLDENPGQYGDNATYRYSTLIQNDTGIPVTNRAVSGWTTGTLLNGLNEKTAGIASVDLIGISIGGNDIMGGDTGAINTATNNLRGIFDGLLTKYPAATIVIHSVYNPIGAQAESIITAMNGAIAGLAEEYDGQVVVLDTYTAFLGKEDTHVCDDHIHPNIAGHRLIADLYEALWAAPETPDEPPKPAVVYGDIDGNPGVTAADALMALQAATGKILLDESQAAAADVDGNPGVTAADALLILQRATGKINAFPVQDEPLPVRTAGNPIFTDIFTADPSAHVWSEAGDERLYVYPSHDQFPAQGCDFMDKYHVYSTTNMVDWYDHGQILSSDDVEWGRPEGGFMWAPDAAYKDGTYYYFFPHPSETDWDRSWKIGVATSDKPAEDFSVVTQKPDGSPYQGYIEGIPYASTRGLIDPCVFKDDDGKYYMSVGGGGKCYLAEMTDDLLGIKEDTWTDITAQLYYPGADRHPGGDARDFHEGSWIFKRGDIYYLMFPDGVSDADGGNRMRYAMADSVMGPYVTQPEPFLDSVLDCDTTHGSIVEYKGHWYIFYHNSALSGAGNLRSVCVDEVFFNDDGTIQKVTQTAEGVSAIGPDETGAYAPNQTGALIISDETIEGYKQTYTHGYDYDLNFATVDVDLTKLSDSQKNPDGTAKEYPQIVGAGASRHTVTLTAPGAYLQFDGVVGGKQDGKALLEVHYGAGDKPNFQVKTTGMEGGLNATTSYYMKMDTTGSWEEFTGVAYCIIDLKAGADNSVWLASGSGGANFTGITVYLPEDNVDPTLQPKDPTVVDYSVYTGPATTYTLKDATVGSTTGNPDNYPVIEGDLTLHNMERGGAYVDIPNIDGGKGGKAMVTLEYCSFNDGSLTLSANGVALELGSKLGFESNESWDSYAGKLVGQVELNAGTGNVIRIAGGGGGVNLRNITVTLLPQD